jgi:cytochrome c oxidase subunit I
MVLPTTNTISIFIIQFYHTVMEAVITQEHGHAAYAVAEHTHDHVHSTSFIRKYIFSTDHKTIAKQFLASSMFFLLVGGAFALFIRWQLAYPGEPIPVIGAWLPDTLVSNGAIQPGFYTQLVTMHATLMIFFVIIPMATGAFANFCIPLMIGTDDMAMPTINMMSFWLVPVAGLTIMGGFFVEGGTAAAGWTNYPPLSTQGMGHTLWVIGIFLVGFSSILGGMNYVSTVLNKRAKGMRMFDMPMTVWALFITAILQTVGTPVLAADAVLLFVDQVFHAGIFIPENLLSPNGGLFPNGSNVGAGGGGQPILWQHLFWFYSHPAVYIMILPAMGVVSDVLATFSRKPIYGYKAMVFAIMAIAFLGFVVWGHHMFISGMSPLLGTTFMLSTIVIAVPSSIKIFNWLGTVWKGNIHFATPNLNALGFISTFVVGGLSGIFMAIGPIDVYIHDTYFIVAHIHYVLFGGALFGIFAGMYYWYPKMFGKMYNESLGKLHFVITFVAFNLCFFPMHMIGVGGHMRRIYDPYVYEFLKPFQPINQFITIFSIILGFAQLILIFNLIWSLKFGKKAPRNPWHANSLEWAAPAHPGHGNFDRDITVYRGPYEFASPESKRDYLPQWIRPAHVEKEVLPVEVEKN